MTRRLIRLELAETKLAEHPTRDPSVGITLFYRLVLTEEGELRIELWERGEFYGARRVSTSHGDKKLLARHIALATAELAQRLNRAFVRTAKTLERQAREAEEDRRLRLERARRERWALIARADAVWLPKTGSWLGGPRLGFQLNQRQRGRLEVTFGGLAGSSGELMAARNLEWFELAVAPAYRFDQLDLAAGFDLAAATLMVTGPVSLDGVPTQRQTWSARGGAHLHYQPRVSSGLRLHLGAEASILLRRVGVTPLESTANSATQSLSGLWLGVNFGVLVDS